MKKVKIFVIVFALSLGLSGCYTQIAKDDPYAEEYKVIKDQGQYADSDVEYDTVYVDENGNPIEEETQAGDNYYINNNYYFDDFDIYRHYFLGYSPCFYCDPFFYAPVVLVGGWYYFAPPYYYFPPSYYTIYPYPYPGYPYYGYYPPYYDYNDGGNVVYNPPYNAGLRNNFGKYARRQGRPPRRHGGVGRDGTSSGKRLGKQINLDDLVVGVNAPKKGGNSGKISNKKDLDNFKKKHAGEITSGSKKKKIIRNPHLRTPGKISNDETVQFAGNKKNTIGTAHKNPRVTQSHKKKKRIVIYKKRPTSSAGSKKTRGYHNTQSIKRERSSRSGGYKPPRRSSSGGSKSRPTYKRPSGSSRSGSIGRSSSRSSGSSRSSSSRSSGSRSHSRTRSSGKSRR